MRVTAVYRSGRSVAVISPINPHINVQAMIVKGRVLSVNHILEMCMPGDDDMGSAEWEGVRSVPAITEGLFFSPLVALRRDRLNWMLESCGMIKVLCVGSVIRLNLETVLCDTVFGSTDCRSYIIGMRIGLAPSTSVGGDGYWRNNRRFYGA